MSHLGISNEYTQQTFLWRTGELCEGGKPSTSVTYLLKISSFVSDKYLHSGSVVECPLCDQEVAGSISGWVIPKTLKMVLAALSLGAQH